MRTIGQKFPTYSLKACVSADGSAGFPIMTDTDKTDAGKWKLYFFWPKDFTFVCPTELTAFNDIYQDLKDRNCSLYGCSTDSDYVHLAWRQNHQDLTDLRYPMLSDIKKELSSALGILHADEGVCYRATYLVDPEGTIRHVSVNDLSVGRNTAEVLRILDGLQSGGLSPCNWKPGDQLIKVA